MDHSTMVNSCARQMSARSRKHIAGLGLSAAMPTRAWRGRLWILSLAGLLGLFITGCGLADPDAIQLDEGVIESTPTPAPLPTLTALATAPPSELITIWLDWEFQELQGLYQAIERYQLQQPGVEFAISYHPREVLLQDFQAATAERQGPSILLGPATWGPILREQGLVLNLSPLLDPGMESDIHPIAWSQAAEGTQLFGLPLELQGMVLYRNRSLVAQPVADLDEWLQVAESLRSEGRVAIIMDMALSNTLPMIAACGEEAFTQSGALSLFERGGECWLRLLSTLGELGDVVFGTDEDVASFKRGGSAWVIASTDMRGELIEAIGITNLEVDPWPLFPELGFPLRGFTWSENAYLVAGSTESDLEASWNFLQFLFGEQGQGILSDPGGAGHIPTTSALEPPDSLMLASSSMLRAGMPWPPRISLEVAEAPLIAAIQAVVLQGAEPGFALRLAEERLELLMSSSLTP